jgi:gluconokinase
MIVVVMGVTGCGKSTVGAALGERLGWPFLDADDFHPPANVAKMASGTALVDEDRWPWLDRIADELRAIDQEGGSAVLACSALKAVYRTRIGARAGVRFVHLVGEQSAIAARLAVRKHRYMPASLLASQFATLERPADAVDVDIGLSVERQVDAICRALALLPAPRASHG